MLSSIENKNNLFIRVVSIAFYFYLKNDKRAVSLDEYFDTYVQCLLSVAITMIIIINFHLVVVKIKMTLQLHGTRRQQER